LLLPPQVGGGGYICFDLDDNQSSAGKDRSCKIDSGKPVDKPWTYSVGIGKYAGISVVGAGKKLCINIGYSSTGLPFSVTAPLFSF
jgi:hypothetical protein